MWEDTLRPRQSREWRQFKGILVEFATHILFISPVFHVIELVGNYILNSSLRTQ